MGGASKPGVELAGEPMIFRPLRALGEVCSEVAVVCKADTELPPLPAGISRWNEPGEPHHPLVGLLHGLERSGGPVLVCAADMPFVSASVLRTLIAEGEAEGDVHAVVAFAGGRLEPLLGLYRPVSLPALRGAPLDARLTTVIEGLEPIRSPIGEGVALSVNTPEALRVAEERLLSV